MIDLVSRQHWTQACLQAESQLLILSVVSGKIWERSGRSGASQLRVLLDPDFIYRNIPLSLFISLSWSKKNHLQFKEAPLFHVPLADQRESLIVSISREIKSKLNVNIGVWGVKLKPPKRKSSVDSSDRTNAWSPLLTEGLEPPSVSHYFWRR